MRSRMMRALTASVAAGMLASGAAVASAGTALAAPASTKVTSGHHAAVPDPTKMPHKKCPKGEHLKKVNGKWGCHKK
ncbi:hypothetical protein AB0A91_11720 [Streptomyces sp. NPDC042207]|uniref:hypothetical protein n=1 Tax=Streptomyces sp. NPDC042207 TaxID=3154331 RepID=UPI00341052BA